MKETERLGVKLPTLSAHVPQSNRSVERMGRTLVTKVPFVVSYSGISVQVWTEVVKHATDLSDLTAMPILDIRTRTAAPFQAVLNESWFQIFGFKTYAYIYKNDRNCEWFPRNTKGLYPANEHGSRRTYSSATKMINTTKYVSFDEKSFRCHHNRKVSSFKIANLQ